MVKTHRALTFENFCLWRALSADKCEVTWLRLFITNAALYCAFARRHYRLESLTRSTLGALHGTAALVAACSSRLPAIVGFAVFGMR